MLFRRLNFVVTFSLLIGTPYMYIILAVTETYLSPRPSRLSEPADDCPSLTNTNSTSSCSPSKPPDEEVHWASVYMIVAGLAILCMSQPSATFHDRKSRRLRISPVYCAIETLYDIYRIAVIWYQGGCLLKALSSVSVLKYHEFPLAQGQPESSTSNGEAIDAPENPAPLPNNPAFPPVAVQPHIGVRITHQPCPGQIASSNCPHEAATGIPSDPEQGPSHGQQCTCSERPLEKLSANARFRVCTAILTLTQFVKVWGIQGVRTEQVISLAYVLSWTLSEILLFMCPTSGALSTEGVESMRSFFPNLQMTTTPWQRNALTCDSLNVAHWWPPIWLYAGYTAWIFSRIGTLIEFAPKSCQRYGTGMSTVLLFIGPSTALTSCYLMFQGAAYLFRCPGSILGSIYRRLLRILKLIVTAVCYTFAVWLSSFADCNIWPVYVLFFATIAAPLLTLAAWCLMMAAPVLIFYPGVGREWRDDAARQNFQNPEDLRIWLLELFGRLCSDDRVFLISTAINGTIYYWVFRDLTMVTKAKWTDYLG